MMVCVKGHTNAAGGGGGGGTATEEEVSMLSVVGSFVCVFMSRLHGVLSHKQNNNNHYQGLQATAGPWFDEVRGLLGAIPHRGEAKG
jgi:hypothetical protein